jgi:hypothetical protein
VFKGKNKSIAEAKEHEFSKKLLVVMLDGLQIQGIMKVCSTQAKQRFD